MKKILLLGDSISLHYRRYLFPMLKGIVSFEPNRVEVSWMTSGTAAAPSDPDFSGYNMDEPAGLNGGDSFRVLEKLGAYREHKLFGADAVLLNCGLHDMKRDKESGALQVELAQYRENLREIAAMLGRERLVWVATTPVKNGRHVNNAFDRLESDHEAYREAAAEIMSGANIPVIDLCAFTRNLPEEGRYCDHVHYSVENRKLQAAFVAGSLAGMID